MDTRTLRRVYLITYSQADQEKFPTRQSFGEVVQEAFNSGSGKVTVQYWATCLETHENGGVHYHTCIKLSGPKRWSSVKNSLLNNHGVSVHFSDQHDSYYSAYRYVTKADGSVCHSDGHPDMTEVDSPKTKRVHSGEPQKTNGSTSRVFKRWPQKTTPSV